MARNWRWLVAGILLLSVLSVTYVRTHPLVFMDTHQHCIKFAGMHFGEYAGKHNGRFPNHPKGYGNALLLMDEECIHALTGPGNDAAALRNAKRTGTDLPEEEYGRVYVQGLTQETSGDVVVLFDKLPTPGGDHCGFPMRIWAPLGREVLFRSGGSMFVRESEWPEFTQKQIELLVKEGFDRKEAERLYASKPK